jgi:hypothetical protein
MNSRLFVITESSCGDPKTEIVHANSQADIAYVFLKKYYFSEYDCGRYNLEYNRVNGIKTYLVRSCILSKEEIENIRDFTEEDSIYKCLSDDDIMKLFYYCYSGGEGDQSGVPGKEWNTVEITEFTDIPSFEVINPRPRKLNKK